MRMEVEDFDTAPWPPAFPPPPSTLEAIETFMHEETKVP